MIGLCEFCAYKQSDCKGNKDLEKLKCDYYKKRPVQNVKQMAERVAELEIKLKDSVKVVRCKDCKHWHSNTEFCGIWSFQNIAQRTLSDDYCSRSERREE